MYGFMNIQKHLNKFFFQPLTAPETLDNFAADFAYKGRNGEPVIETTWHNVTAWEGNKGIPSLDIICKGFPVYVAGRLRSQKYTANDGTERTSMEVIASTVEPVDGNVSAQC